MVDALLCRHDQEEFFKVPWHVVVFDEVHQIKNPQSKTYQACSRLKCKLRYGLSGTIMPVRSFSCLGWQVPLSSLWGVE